MSKKYGLGKGLGALIPENELESESENTINFISLNLIKANNEQPRKKFDEEKIVQLSESIKEHGLIQPIVLSKVENFYIIIAGERRWRAAKMAGLKEVPAVVMNVSDKEILEISLIENIQREDLNPIEEALAYKKLLEEFNLTHEDLSRRVGKSRVSITNCLRLLNLDLRVKEYLIDGVISEGHGRIILSVEDKDLQYEICQKIIDEGLSVREAETLIKNIKKPKPTSRQGNKDDVYYIDIKEKLENILATKVNLKSKANRKSGKIEIEFYSNDDLQRILDIFKL